MEKRLKFTCWNCEREFSLFLNLEPDEEPILVVECPFCGSQCVTDLAKFRTPVEAVARGDVFSTGAKPIGYRYDIPEILETAEPKPDN